jgi:hypothetical protein
MSSHQASPLMLVPRQLHQRILQTSDRPIHQRRSLEKHRSVELWTYYAGASKDRVSSIPRTSTSASTMGISSLAHRMVSSRPKPLPAPVITATSPSLGYSYPYPSVRRRAATERSALARYGRFLRTNVAIATKSTQKLICARLWVSRPPAAVHSLFVERSTPSTAGLRRQFE